MSEAVPEPEAVQARLRSMGLESRLLPGGRSALVTLWLSPRPFESPARPLRIEQLFFFTVGGDRIKCVSPRPLFYLPLISIAGCDTPAQIEERIRLAWGRRCGALARTQRWMRELGGEPEFLEDAPALAISLGLEDPTVRAIAIEPGRLILPSRGPLSGTPLPRPEDRVFTPDPGCASALELELALTTRAEELAREETERAQHRRLAVVAARGLRVVERRVHRILLVGPRVGWESEIAQCLRLRGHGVDRVRSMRDALAVFRLTSYELVVADAQLDRAEGIELIPALGELPGIARIPLVVVDDRPRPARREAARRLGAAGYAVHPIGGERFADRLAKLLESPRHRRFTRHPSCLAVRWANGTQVANTRTVGRGGVSLRTRWDPAPHVLDRFEISLPELHCAIQVEAEVRYGNVDGVSGSNQVGLRFASFCDDDEHSWIAYLQHLESSTG